MASVAASLYPARCRTHGASVTGGLWSDPDGPMYRCGCTGYDQGAGPLPEPSNLVPLTDADVLDVRGLGVAIVLSDVAPTEWTRDPRIALGPCGHVTISGECLSLDDPMAART